MSVTRLYGPKLFLGSLNIVSYGPIRQICTLSLLKLKKVTELGVASPPRKKVMSKVWKAENLIHSSITMVSKLAVNCSRLSYRALS